MNKNMISRWFSMYVLMMMFGIMGATAQSLSIADFAIRAGESKTITMNLAQGGQTVYGVQTDLTLPEGLTIEGEPAIVEGAITNGTLSKNLLTSGALRLILMSYQGDAFVAEATGIITMTVKAADTFAGGNITLTNNRITTSAAGAETTADNATTNVTLNTTPETVYPAADAVIVDVLNNALTGVTGTNYKDWTGKTATSTAVYAGNSAGDKSSIQLRSNNNNSGVVTTTSGGKVKKVAVKWNSGTAAGRVLNVYGSNTAYTAATDLYDTSKQGTLIATFNMNNGDGSAEITGEYAYVGFRSASGAMYLDEVSISWEGESSSDVAAPTFAPAATATFFGSQTVTLTAEEGADIYYVTDDSELSSDCAKYVEPITINATTTIRAFAVKEGKGSPEAKATYTFGPTVANIAAFKETTTTAQLTLVDAVVTHAYSGDKGDYVFVEDASGAICFSKTGLALAKGNKLNGTIIGKLTSYYGLPQFTAVEDQTSLDAVQVTEDGTFAPAVVTIEEASNAAYAARMIKILGGTITKSDGKWYITVGEQSLQIYKNTSYGADYELPAEGTEMKSITGLLVPYNDTYEICPLSQADIVEKPIIEFQYAKYIIKNTASGKYLSAGNSWGTQASLVAHPEYVKLSPNEDDGTYKIESQVKNGDGNYWLNTDGFMDGKPADAVVLNVTKVSDGVYTISNGTKFYGWDGTSTVLARELAADSENALWSIQTLDDAKAALVNATATVPMDATVLIEDHDFGRGNRYENRWQGAFGHDNHNGNNVAEWYMATGDVYQELTGINNGIYKVEAQAAVTFHDDRTVKEYDGNGYPVVYANSETSNFLDMETADRLTSQTTMGQRFDEGKYQVEPIFVQVTDGTLKVGAKSERNDIWAVFDNFVLTYYGAEASMDEVKNAAILAEMNALRLQLTAIKEDVEIQSVLDLINNALTSTEGATGTEGINAAIVTLKAALETAQAYVKAKNVLPKMQQLTVETNFYTEEALNQYYTQWATKYQSGTLTKDEADALQDPNIVAGHHSANTVDDLLMSVWDETPENWESYHVNNWSTEGGTDGSNFVVPFIEYWTGDANSLGEKALTATMTGLEEGHYQVGIRVRVRVKNAAQAPATGITMNVNDEKAVDVCAGTQVGETQFYLGEFTAEGDVYEEGVLKLNINVAADNNISWLAFKDAMYTRLGEVVGIAGVKSVNKLDGTIYNLNGQKVEKAQKGLYIINGKKVVVK